MSMSGLRLRVRLLTATAGALVALVSFAAYAKEGFPGT
jgi:hypothetical protein